MSHTFADDARPHQLGRAVRRYAVVVVLLTALVGAAAAVFASGRTASYSSSARFLLRPTVGNPFSPETGSSGQQVTIAMQTEAALVDSDPVLALVNAKIDPDITAQSITVTVPPSTQTVLVTAKASTAANARAAAQAVADSYLAYRKSITEGTRKARIDQVTKQISSVKSSLASAAKAAGTSSDTEASRQLQVLTEQLISLQDSLSTANAINPDPGTLVTPASLPSKPSGIDSRLIIAVGALVGLFLGLALALWLGRRDKRVHGRSTSVVAGVPVLAVFGVGRKADREQADKRAYQRLRTSILASSALPSAVAVSGLTARDHSSSVAVELGHSMTRAGYRVVLVLTSQDESGQFADDPRYAHGLADVLRSERNVLSLLTDHDGLKVLPAGGGILEVQELLSGERFGRVVTELKGSFDYVLVVTGSAALPAELATARLADSLLLVGRDETTSRVDVADVAARASLLGLRVTGLVLRPRRERPTAQATAGKASPPTASAAQPGHPTTSAQPLQSPQSAQSVQSAQGSDDEQRRPVQTLESAAEHEAPEATPEPR